MPRDASPSGSGVRAYAFSQKAVCLKAYAAVMQQPAYADARRFFLDAAYNAWSVFEDLRRDQTFKVFHQKKSARHARRSPVTKDLKTGDVTDVASGVLLPIMSALGKFVRKASDGPWSFEVRADFDTAGLITAAELTFSSKQDPAKMCKESDRYLALHPSVAAYLKYRTPR